MHVMIDLKSFLIQLKVVYAGLESDENYCYQLLDSNGIPTDKFMM